MPNFKVTLFCIGLIFTTFFIPQPAYAQIEIESSHFQLNPWSNKEIPIEMRKGEEIQGTVKVTTVGIAPLPPTVTFDLTDNGNNRNICTFGREVQSIDFYYAAEVDGIYLLVFTDTKGIAPIVDLSYSLVTSTHTPGQTSGETLSYWDGSAWQRTGSAPSTNPVSPASSPIDTGLAVILVIAVIIVFALFAFMKGRASRNTIVLVNNDDASDIVDVEVGETQSRNSTNRISGLYSANGLRSIHQDGLNKLGKRQRDNLDDTLRKLR